MSRYNPNPIQERFKSFFMNDCVLNDDGELVGAPELFECAACNREFEEWTGGMKVPTENEFYCPHCISTNYHVAYIRDYCSNCDQPTKTANQIIESLKYI